MESVLTFENRCRKCETVFESMHCYVLILHSPAHLPHPAGVLLFLPAWLFDPSIPQKLHPPTEVPQLEQVQPGSYQMQSL